MKNLVRLGLFAHLEPETQSKLSSTHRVKILSDGDKQTVYTRLDRDSVLLLQLKGIDWLPVNSLRDIQQEADLIWNSSGEPERICVSRVRL